jgi:uncharacterized protein
MEAGFSIEHYPFDHTLEQNMLQRHRDFLVWPLVYLLSDDISRSAYVGETTDVLNRMKMHAKTEGKRELTTVNLITSNLFNKSATLDLEANLIRYMSADRQYKLQNGNLGIANHRYYQQDEVYRKLFSDIWNELRSLGIARHSLEHIDNSDLFKYSPYKSLSKEQVAGLKMTLKCLLDRDAKVSLIHGGAGTGKSILAIFLFKLLKTNLEDFSYADLDEDDAELFSLLKAVREQYGDLNMALVIPMASFRKTIADVFAGIRGLSPKMVIAPTELAKQRYDLVIVDEGHRLRRRVNLGPYFKPFDTACESLGFDKHTASELDWVHAQCAKALIFYDRYQSVKPSDVLRGRFITLENHPTTRVETLQHQFRAKGGNNLVRFVHQLLENGTSDGAAFHSPDYELFLFSDLGNMIDEIRKKEQAYGLSRLIAGYAWEWVSKTDKDAYDITIGSTRLRWNSTGINWVNSKKAIHEVGCIHTTQGYDLNYAGIIIGPELDYDFERKQLVVYKDRYKDKAGKNTVTDEAVLKEYILNIYKTILLRGIKGAYIYACNKNMRTYLEQVIPAKDRPEQKASPRIKDQPNEGTIPYYDLKIAAGTFSDLQQPGATRYIELDSTLPNRENYFACQVVGESMNRIIPNGAICLFERYTGGSRNGRITLTELIDYTDPDFGSCHTIKEYRSKKTSTENGWTHEEIILSPQSTKQYEPIVLRDEETIGLKVVGIFVKVIG